MEEESDTGRIVKQKGDSDEKINIQEGHNLHGRQKSRLCFFIPFFRKGMNYIKGQPPGRIIAMGFAFVILTGSFLLMLPCSVREGAQVSFIDALFTSASAVCVTGLIAIDTAEHFTVFGRTVVALLIQIGGLGVTSVSVGFILIAGKRVGLKGRRLVREAMNVNTSKGMVRLVKNILLMTLCFECVGAVLSFLVFVRDYPPLEALGISLFHSVASFNNSGFDILGGGQNLIPYQDDILLNLVTCVLVIFGGIGFLVIREVIAKRFRWKKLSMHAKVVLFMSLVLTAAGTVLLKLTEDITWMGAFFTSVSARTAGFSTFPLGSFSGAGLLTVIVLMVIGASPGSTGGGIKTTTCYVLFEGIRSSATNTSEKAFRYAVPADAFRKAAVITLLAIGIVLSGTYILVILEPGVPFLDALFEMSSAFGTAGLSTGISAGLCDAAKILTILIMFIGRLGPLTIASLWYFTKGERVSYPEGNIAIG